MRICSRLCGRGLPRVHVIGLGAMLGAIGGMPLIVYAAPIHAMQPFALSGTATLKLGASVQATGALQLQARLSRSDNERDASNAQEGAGFALTARLAAAPLICSDDTIFQNGFDS